MAENADDVSTLVELDRQLTIEKTDEDKQIDRNRFNMLCNNVQNCFYEIDKSMFEILELKDKLLLQYLPRNVFVRITLVLSRFYRAYSQSQVPVYELIRLVQLYSKSFDNECSLLKRLYDSNEVKKRMLNLALQKLTSVENHMKQYQEQKSIDNWEKMYIRLALPRANLREWKFRIKTFREKSERGYEHVVEWLHTRIPNLLITSDNLSIEDLSDDEISLGKRETSNDSEQIGSSISVTRNLQFSQSQQPIVTKTDIEIQVQPDIDDQQTSTEDILLTKSLLMRIYRPIGIDKTKFKCFVHAHGQTYTTKIFNLNKSNAPSTTSRRTIKSKKPSENLEMNTVDTHQTDEIFVPVPDVLRRHSIYEPDTDPDAIKIDVFGDETLCGSFVLSSEDLRMLDLPNLSNSTLSPFIENDKNLSTDFDQTSIELYQSRPPQIFSIYNNKHEIIGKLPLSMFWYHKSEYTHATKSTMTDVMETPVSMVKTESFGPSDISEISNEILSLETMKAVYETKIAELHENYRAEIQRLTNLLNQIFSDKITETSEPDENQSETISKNPSSINLKPQTKRVSTKAQVDGKDLPKNFLDRYEMYLKRSIIHRHQLMTKIEHETSFENQLKMEIQHRLHRSERNNEPTDDLCLPAVFMPFRSGNVVNPRAYQYFHPYGSTNRRLTQAPSVLKYPSLPSRSVSVLNLFEISQKYEKPHSNTQTLN